MDLKHLRIVEVGYLNPVKRELGLLSASVEYKLNNPENLYNRELITDEEIYKSLRKIIGLIKDL